MDNNKKIVRVENGSIEHLLPVHFLPEGKKCYDWIKNDVEKDDEERTQNKLKYTEKGILNLNSESDGNIKTSDTLGLDHLNEITFDLNSVDKFLEAAEEGCLTEVERLLDKTPSLLNCTDSDLYTALHRASYNGRTEIIKYLIERGANISAKTVDGWQPLHSACRWGQIEAALILLQNGAEVNAQSNGGQTPLHLASTIPDRAQLLELLLLQKDIDITIKSNSNDTAYDIAFRNGPHYKLFELVDKSVNVDLD